MNSTLKKLIINELDAIRMEFFTDDSEAEILQEAIKKMDELIDVIDEIPNE